VPGGADPAALVWIAVDDRLRLREAETQYQLLFERNPLPFWVFHREALRILEANDAAVAASTATAARNSRACRWPTSARPKTWRKCWRWRAASHRNTPRAHLAAYPSQWRDVHVSVHSADITFRGQPARLVLALDVSERLRDQERLSTASSASSWWRARLRTPCSTGTSSPAKAGAPTASTPSSITAATKCRRPSAAGASACTETTAPASTPSSRPSSPSDEVEWQDTYRFRRGDGSYAYVLDRGRLERSRKASRCAWSAAWSTSPTSTKPRWRCGEQESERPGRQPRRAHRPAQPQRAAAALEQLTSRGARRPCCTWRSTSSP
jgi:hypothetical protein